MEANYAKIGEIEQKVMVELYGENFELAGGNCGPMSDDEEGSADSYVDSLEELNDAEKVRLKDAYNKIQKLYMEYDSIAESNKTNSRAVEILAEIQKVVSGIQDLEDKLALTDSEVAPEGISVGSREEVDEFVDGLNLDDANKTELKKLYAEVFTLYEDLGKLYDTLGENEVTAEFTAKDREISGKLEKIYNQIFELENLAK